MTGWLKVLALSVLRGFRISKGVTRQKQAEMHKALAKRQFRLWGSPWSITLPRCIQSHAKTFLMSLQTARGQLVTIAQPRKHLPPL